MKYNKNCRKVKGYIQTEAAYSEFISSIDKSVDGVRLKSCSAESLEDYMSLLHSEGKCSKKLCSTTIKRLKRNDFVELKTYKIVYEALGLTYHSSKFIRRERQLEEINSIPPPESIIPVDSIFYIPNELLEQSCLSALTDFSQYNKQGSLIRLRSPKFTGKTTFLRRISYLVSEYKEKILQVFLSFNKLENSKLKNLDKLYHWLGYTIASKLGLENRIDDYWDDEGIGSNESLTSYLVEYILASIEANFVLIIDDVDAVLSHPEVAEDFFGLLRSWHEIEDIFQQFRLIFSYSTYSGIKINSYCSPFNIGVGKEMEMLSVDQIYNFAFSCNIDFSEQEASSLFSITGGNPYLVRLAFYEAFKNEVRINEVLKNCTAENGIYIGYLRQLKHDISNLLISSAILKSLKRLTATDSPIELDSDVYYSLSRLGLIKIDGNLARLSGDLYRDYFGRVLI